MGNRRKILKKLPFESGYNPEPIHVAQSLSEEDGRSEKYFRWLKYVEVTIPHSRYQGEVSSSCRG